MEMWHNDVNPNYVETRTGKFEAQKWIKRTDTGTNKINPLPKDAGDQLLLEDEEGLVVTLLPLQQIPLAPLISCCCIPRLWNILKNIQKQRRIRKNISIKKFTYQQASSIFRPLGKKKIYPSWQTVCLKKNLLDVFSSKYKLCWYNISSLNHHDMAEFKLYTFFFLTFLDIFCCRHRVLG